MSPLPAALIMPATSRPPFPGTRPRSRPPTRLAAVCRRLQPFHHARRLVGLAFLHHLVALDDVPDRSEDGVAVGPGHGSGAEDEHRAFRRFQRIGDLMAAVGDLGKRLARPLRARPRDRSDRQVRRREPP